MASKWTLRFPLTDHRYIPPSNRQRPVAVGPKTARNSPVLQRTSRTVFIFPVSSSPRHAFLTLQLGCGPGFIATSQSIFGIPGLSPFLNICRNWVGEPYVRNCFALANAGTVTRTTPRNMTPKSFVVFALTLRKRSRTACDYTFARLCAQSASSPWVGSTAALKDPQDTTAASKPAWQKNG